MMYILESIAARQVFRLSKSNVLFISPVHYSSYQFPIATALPAFHFVAIRIASFTATLIKHCCIALVLFVSNRFIKPASNYRIIFVAFKKNKGERTANSLEMQTKATEIKAVSSEATDSTTTSHQTSFYCFTKIYR